MNFYSIDTAVLKLDILKELYRLTKLNKMEER